MTLSSFHPKKMSSSPCEHRSGKRKFCGTPTGAVTGAQKFLYCFLLIWEYNILTCESFEKCLKVYYYNRVTTRVAFNVSTLYI